MRPLPFPVRTMVLAALCLLGIAGRAEAVSITEFPLTVPQSTPLGIAAGADGNMWFTEVAGSRVGRITPEGAVTDWSTGSGISANSRPWAIAAGPDGNLWFTEESGNRIGRITPTGVVTEFTAGISAMGRPAEIAAGPDRDLWFTEGSGNRIARIRLEPAVTTGSAELLASTAATLSGTVDPFSSRTSYVFEYGDTTAYGSVTRSQTLAPGVASVAITTGVGGLQPGTLYHYRLVASSAGGVSFGADRTFTTPSADGQPGGGRAEDAPPASPDRVGPRLNVLSRALVLTRTGRVQISLRCPLTETLGCRGTVRLETAAQQRRLRLGSAALRIGGGQAVALTIRVSQRGRTLVRRLERLRVRVVVIGVDASGNRRTTVKQLSLRSRTG